MFMDSCQPVWGPISSYYRINARVGSSERFHWSTRQWLKRYGFHKRPHKLRGWSGLQEKAVMCMKGCLILQRWPFLSLPKALGSESFKGTHGT